MLSFLVLILLLTAKLSFPPEQSPAVMLADSSLAAAMLGLTTSVPERDPSPQEHSYYNSSPFTNNQPATLFPFDPNELDAAGWARLGLREKTIQTILRYRDRGRFRKPADLERIYGLSAKDYQRLLPYVRIPAPGHSFTAGREAFKAPARQPRSYPVIDINTADTSDWIVLPGIGSRLASRIVLFRDKLGGFHQVEQVAEVYGLPDSTFLRIRQYLQSHTSLLRKLNINTATLDELKAHPYIRWQLARLIVAYRQQHGPFRDTEQLLQVEGFTRELYHKLLPYLLAE